MFKKEAGVSINQLVYLLLMEEILDHLGCMNPCKYWNKLPINWCRISSITSIKPDLNWVLGRYFCSFKPQRIHISELGTQAFNAGSGSTCNVGTTDKWLCQCWKTVVPSQNAKRFEWVDIYIYMYIFCVYILRNVGIFWIHAIWLYEFLVKIKKSCAKHRSMLVLVASKPSRSHRGNPNSLWLWAPPIVTPWN